MSYFQSRPKNAVDCSKRLSQRKMQKCFKNYEGKILPRNYSTRLFKVLKNHLSYMIFTEAYKK